MKLNAEAPQLKMQTKVIKVIMKLIKVSLNLYQNQSLFLWN